MILKQVNPTASASTSGFKIMVVASHLARNSAAITDRADHDDCMESFHGTLKREYVWPHEFACFRGAEMILAVEFVDYN